jgi:hypothetical protein
MKQKICLLALGALLLSPFGATRDVEAENQCQQNIFISEIGWAGSSRGAADEWLELANAGENGVTLAGWIIEGAGTSGSNLILPENAKILPRSIYLIANYNAENDKSNLAAPPDYVNTAVSLSNSTLRLVLKSEDGCQIDTAGDGSSPFFGGTASGGTVSMVRLEPLTDGVLSAAWSAAETSEGFDSPNDSGTPGTMKWKNILSSAIEITTETETKSEAPAETEINTMETTTETVLTPLTETLGSETNLAEPTAVLSETSSSPEEQPENETDETTEESTTDEILEKLPPTETLVEIKEGTGDEEEKIELIDEETSSETAEVTEITSVVEMPPEQSPQSLQSPSEEEAVVTIVYTKRELLINEFVADPVKNEKEWVEVINPNKQIITLVGWKISESSGRTISLPEGELGYGQVAFAEFSSNALNNQGDKIQIIAPDGTVVDEIEYGTATIPNADDPFSVARGATGNFVVTETPTKGTANIITTTIIKTETTTCSESKENGEKKEEETNQVEAEKEVLPTIQLSELYPNTNGSDATDEFVEVENYGPETIDLFELILKDAAGNDWAFPDHRNLTAGNYLTVYRSEYKFALNNSGEETVGLYSAKGTLLDQTQYENAPKNSTYARDGSTWRWTLFATPNEPNRFSETLADEDSGLVRQASTNLDDAGITATESIASLNLTEARTATSGTRVRLEGIVTVEPGLLGKQVFYLTDNVVGLQIYKADGEFPELFVGDLIELTGTVSVNRGEPRVKIGSEDEIVVITGQVALEVAEVETLGPTEAGRLVKLTGLVIEKSSDRFTIETNDGLAEVKIKERTGITLAELKPGVEIMATGIVGQAEEKYFLLPRSSDDLTVVMEVNPAQTVASNESSEPTGKQSASKANQRNALLVGGVVLVGLTARTLLKRRGNKIKPYEKADKFSFAAAG